VTAEIVGRAIVIAGALLLVVGPGMQARAEMREYHELLDALIDDDLPGQTREYLRLLSVGPSMALHSPLGLLRFAASAWAWYPRYRTAHHAFQLSAGQQDARFLAIRAHLVSARNWAIVVAGSLLILVGASLELAQSLSS
jgi:sulfite exporter TauE/SafE